MIYSPRVVSDDLSGEMVMADVDPSQDMADTQTDEIALTEESTSVASSSWQHRLHSCVRDNQFLCVAVATALTCVIVNWVLMELMSNRLREGIRQDLVLRETTSQRWMQPGANAFLSIYDFRVGDGENGSLVFSDNEPHVYRLDMEKVNVTWNSNFSVSYQEQLTLHDHNRPAAAKIIHSLLGSIIKNGTEDHVLNVMTGESSFDLASQAFSWNYSRQLPFWTTQEANEIMGTDGSVFPPFLDETSSLTLFYPQLRRKFHLAFLKSTFFKDQPVYRFTVADSEFSNTTRSSASNRTRTGQDMLQNVGNGYCRPVCLPNGAYTFSVGRAGAALFISLPHFLGADPYYTQHLEGLQPDEARHRPFFEVDKLTGITVRQKRRFQVNMRSSWRRGFQFYEPVYWFELSVEASDEVLSYIARANSSFKLLYGLCTCVGVLLGLSLVALVSCLVYRIIKTRTTIRQYMRLTTLNRGGCCGST